MQTFSRNLQPYTAFFCEENVWQLARQLIDAGFDSADLQALWICNRSASVLMFNQRSAAPGAATVWDYHVVLRIAGVTDLILDADTRLPYPCRTRDYLLQSFPPSNSVPPRFLARIRIVPATQFMRRFDSDRGHMLGRLPADAFPSWPPIRATGKPITLRHYCNMDAPLDDGSRVMTVDALLHEVA